MGGRLQVAHFHAHHHELRQRGKSCPFHERDRRSRRLAANLFNGPSHLSQTRELMMPPADQIREQNEQDLGLFCAVLMAMIRVLRHFSFNT